MNSIENNMCLGTGNHITHQLKNVIINLMKYFESKNNWSEYKIINEISEAIKIGKTSIYKIIKEFKGKGECTSPKKRIRINNGYKFDESDKQIIDNTINKLYR